MSDPNADDLIACDRSRILIVDDEKSIREVFAQIVAIGLPGCRVDLAVNGAEAFDSFRNVHHGLLLMDLHMPVMNGEDAFLKINEYCVSENWEMPPVVFCTGYAPSQPLQKMVANSRQHCILRKPVNTDSMIEILEMKLGRK